MKKLILSLFLSLTLWGPVHASGGGVAWDKFPKERLADSAALQNGAKLFVNYCLGCHSAAYVRYNRLRDLGLTDDASHVNPNGGAIALGHPLGMSGARLVTTAAYELKRRGGRYALCTMCIGVGQGIAMVIERI